MMYHKSQGAQDHLNASSTNLQARVEELENKLLKQSELEQMVEESEQRFKQILSLTYDGIILYEKNSGEIIEANIRLIHKMKYKRDNVIGKNVCQFVVPEQYDMIKERITEDLPNVYEAILLDKDEKRYDFEVCSRSCQYHGRKIKMAAVCDISYRKQYEKSIKESEEKFRSLCENTEDSIILTDQKEIIYVNPPTPHIFGLASEKPVVDLLQTLEHIHPDDRTCEESLIQSVVAGQKQTKNSQFRIVTKDGKERWIWNRIFPVAPDDPDNTKLIIVSSDFTDIHEKEEIQKKTEIAARTAEEKYKVLISMLHDMVFETDTSGRLTFINLHAMEIFECGSDLFENPIHFIDLISKEDRQRCKNHFQKIIAGETTPKLELMAIKSEHKFPVELYASRLISNGEITGLSILMFDNTVKKMAEKKALNYKENMSFLSKSALKFLTFSSDDDIFIFIGKSLSKVASKSVIAVFSYDQDNNTSNIRYISGIYPHIENLIDILGKPPEDFIFKLPSKFKHKYLSEKTLRQFDNNGLINAMSDDWPVEKIEQIFKLLHVDSFFSMGVVRDKKLYGGLLIANNSKSDSFDSQTIETFIYQAGIALHRKQIDNELVKAKQTAIDSDRLKSSFLANMSHEVRTPLNGILGIAQVLLKAEDIAPNVRNDVKMIVESGSSLLALIEDIMDVSKIEAGQMKIKYKPFHLNTLMDQLYSLFLAHPLYLQKNAIQQNIVLQYHKSSENITMISDPDRLQQIFVNLIGNALKFTQQGFVQYGYFIKKRDITFFVKDSGIGIPNDKTEKIFERFTQVDNTLARKFSGSGLGLAISKGLINLLKGKIWCESDLGKGSNFYFTIPYHPTSMLDDMNTPQKINANDYDWSNHIILIVEDDVINYKVIEAMLRNTKVKTIHADTGLKAIEQLRLNPQIDVVLMDVHLPEMSGLEATKCILEINPKLPIIAQTANAMSDDKDKCLEAGCADYISKPIDMSNLFAKISQFFPDK